LENWQKLAVREAIYWKELHFITK